MSRITLRVAVVPVVAAALALAAAGAVALSLSPVVPKASAYVLGNGCDEYDPTRGIYYRCTPDRTTFYTPDGINPNSVPVGARYSSFGDGLGTIYDTGGIPPPAPYRAGRDYCSNPWFANSAYEGKWQFSCYKHDVCYGSQKGRKYCDVQFWKDMVAECKRFGWYNPDRYGCLLDARLWYYAVRWFGVPSYVPRRTSLEPAGT
jgi:hypothetical protein